MNPVLAHALEPVIRDISATGASMPIIEDQEWNDSERVASGYLRDHRGGGTGYYVELDTSVVEQVAHVSEQVQEWVIEEHWAAGSNWPICPVHPTTHPMAVEILDSVARWRCPKDATMSFKIGTLTGESRS